MGLWDVVVKRVLAYPGPRGFSGEAEYAPVLYSATQGDWLDDVVDRRSREAPVAELQGGEPVGAAEGALDRADPAQPLLWGAGSRPSPQAVGG